MKQADIKKHQVTPYIELQENEQNGYKSIFAIQKLNPNTILSKLMYQGVLENPTRHTIQIDENQHIEPQPEYLRYTNHSCHPNAYFDTQKMELITLRTIKMGEEITFFYPSTEWKMDKPFDCGCGSIHCLGQVGGTFYLTVNSFRNYKLSDFAIEKYRKLKNLN